MVRFIFGIIFAFLAGAFVSYNAVLAFIFFVLSCWLLLSHFRRRAVKLQIEQRVIEANRNYRQGLITRNSNGTYSFSVWNDLNEYVQLAWEFSTFEDAQAGMNSFLSKIDESKISNGRSERKDRTRPKTRNKKHSGRSGNGPLNSH